MFVVVGLVSLEASAVAEAMLATCFEEGIISIYKG